jgi:hypothetical protein
MKVSAGDLVDRLCIVNMKQWHLENEIRHMRDARMPLSEIGRRALLIRDLNKERVEYKNSISKLFSEQFGDVKVDHASAYYWNQIDKLGTDVSTKIFNKLMDRRIKNSKSKKRGKSKK